MTSFFVLFFFKIVALSPSAIEPDVAFQEQLLYLQLYISLYTVAHGIFDLASIEDFTLKNLCNFWWDF